MEDVLKYKVYEGIAIIEINRPPYNPLNQDVLLGITNVAEELYGNTEIRALVIRGAGEKAFSAGADINQFIPKLGNIDITITSSFHKTFDLLTKLPIPVIAALKGHVLGGGFELALACDFRICDENTKFGLPEVNLGLFPGAGGTQRLPRLIGKSRAMEMMMFGTPISADEAERFGLVNKVVPVGTVENEALEWASKLKEKPYHSVKSIKKSIHYGLDLPLTEGLQYEMDKFSELFTTSDAKEGLQAFLEKRNPQFSRE